MKMRKQKDMLARSLQMSNVYPGIFVLNLFIRTVEEERKETAQL